MFSALPGQGPGSGPLPGQAKTRPQALLLECSISSQCLPSRGLGSGPSSAWDILRDYGWVTILLHPPFPIYRAQGPQLSQGMLLIGERPLSNGAPASPKQVVGHGVWGGGWVWYVPFQSTLSKEEASHTHHGPLHVLPTSSLAPVTSRPHPVKVKGETEQKGSHPGNRRQVLGLLPESISLISRPMTITALGTTVWEAIQPHLPPCPESCLSLWKQDETRKPSLAWQGKWRKPGF